MRRLTYEEIKEISFGALSIFESKGIHFLKCTPKQTEAWNSISDKLGQRSLTTSGVRLDFITNSKKLRFDTNGGDKFEVLIDGLQRKRFFMTELHNNDLCAEMELGEGNKRVTLVFPSHEVGVLSFIELEKNSNIKKVSFKKKILFLGDSITQGWESEYDSLSFAWRVGMFYDADFIIQGIGGAGFCKTTLDKDISYDPDIVIVAYGINDCNSCKDFSKIDEEIKGYFSEIKDIFSSKKIVAITPTWCAEIQHSSFADKFNKICRFIRKSAQKNGCEVIEGMSLVPHIPEMYKDKGLHPNDIGFGLYAENFIKSCMKII